MEKKTIGAFISALRKANGMTQQDLADRLGVSNKAVSRWERDENAPDLSLIPAIAELFGVTCDELLKGERIFRDAEEPTKPEPKVDKQLKSLVSRALTKFKTLIYIALALSCTGYIVLLGFAYGLYLPIVGLALAMLFVAAATVLTVIGVNNLKSVREDNELFESAPDAILETFDRTMGNDTFASLFSALAVFVLSLPQALGGYNEVMIFSDYLAFVGILLPLLILLLLGVRRPFCTWLTRRAYDDVSKKAPRSPLCKTMNGIQLLSLVLAVLILVFSPYVTNLDSIDVAAFIALGLMAFDIACFVFFLIRYWAQRKEFLLIGVRNLILLFPAFLSSAIAQAHVTVAPGQIPSYEVSVNTVNIFIALFFFVLIFCVFAVIENALQKHRPAKNE